MRARDGGERWINPDAGGPLLEKRSLQPGAATTGPYIQPAIHHPTRAARSGPGPLPSCNPGHAAYCFALLAGSGYSTRANEIS